MLEETEDPEEFRVLPQSQIVQDALQFLSNKTETNRASPGYQTSAMDVQKMTCPESYHVHSPFLSTLPPPLEHDAVCAGISEGSTVTIKVEQLKKWEGRLRTLTNICSHIDWFNAANFVTTYDCINQDRHSLTRVQLIKGQSRAVRHAINASVSLTADMLQVRRDAALATSRNLLDSSKEQLRLAPLESPLLFGDQVRSV